MAVPRRSGPSGRNRRWLFILGVLALLAGLATGAIALNLANPALSAANLQQVAPDPTSPVVGPVTMSPWAWLLIAAGGVLLLGLGLGWLVGQFPKPVPGKPFRLHTNPEDGTTVVTRSAIDKAVSEEINSLPEVVRCSVDVRGASVEPILEARVTVNERADVQRLLSQLESGPVRNLGRSLGGQVTDLRVFLDVTSSTRTDKAVTLSAGQ